VPLLAMQLPGEGSRCLRLPRHAAGFSPVRNFNALAASISRSIRWRVRDAVTGFTFQIGLSASSTCSVVISCTFRSCRIGTVADGARPLLLLFLRQTLAPAGYCSSANSLNALPSCEVARFLTRGSTPSRFKATLYSRALLRALLNVSTSPARAVAVADFGELYLRSFAVKVGEAESPRSITALAHDQIKPPAIRMDARLQRFNLVRIECHFNVPLRLPLTVTDASLATVSRSKNDLFWYMIVTDTLEGREPRQLTAFSPKAAGVRRFRVKSDDSRCR